MAHSSRSERREAGAEAVGVADALRLQAAACRTLGSTVYGDLLDGFIADHEDGGPTAALLDGRSPRPLHDALALRLLGTLHRFVLLGEAPALGRHYASAGGHYDGSPAAATALLTDALATIAARRDDVVAGLGRQVQTNEVGRAATLVGGFCEIARRAGGRPLRLREFGASAGLLLNWDRYHYDTGTTTAGEPSATLRFGPECWETDPPVLGPVVVADRQGSDIAPIDVTSADGRLTLQSFVWPDQAARFARLTAALDTAAAHPAPVERADAASWLAEQLADEGVPGTVTVVYHSIVVQYLPRPVLERVRATIVDAGRRATTDQPVAWLRLEPAGAVADLRLTLWPGGVQRGGVEEVLATSGYHGPPVCWAAGAPSGLT